MDTRAHSGENFNRPGQTSRMKEDLSTCSENLMSRLKQRMAAKFEDGIPVATRGLQDLHVGIVGAGLAGLRCAEALIEMGITVTVIEARDRVGGRIHQCCLLGQLVDMGPNWIYGTGDNPMLKLAQGTDSKLITPSEKTYVYDSNGVLMSDQQVSDGFTAFWDILADASSHSDANCSNIEPNLSLQDWFRNGPRASALDEELRRFTLELAETWGAFVGDLFERQSLKWFWLEECLTGENLFVSNTHQQIIKRVSEAVKSHASIQLSNIAQGVDTQDKKEGSGKVVVKTMNGDFSFDEVVVTIPLGCLKEGSIRFHPDLPENITRAIADASYSRLEKAFVAFPTPFWEQSNTNTFESGRSPLTTENTFPMFTYFLHPTYASQGQASWTLEMTALSSPAVFGTHAQPVLVFHLWGTSATHVTSAIAGLSPSSDEYYNVINDLFRPFYSRLPNYQQNHPDCIPTAVLATNWQNDEFAGNGSYTNFMTDHRGGQPKDDPAIDDNVRAMRHGLPERGIWFAGEHTAPFVALGTSTGAYWSGEAAATRIVEAYTLSAQRQPD